MRISLRAADRMEPAAAKSYAPRLDLIDSYDPELGRGLPKPSYAAIYNDGRKQLTFLAVEHGVSSFRLVEKALNGPRAPEVVIVETDEDQAADEGIISKHEGDSEAYHAAGLARRKKILVRGGELSPVAQLNAVLNLHEGFTLKDYEGFYLVRTIADPGRKGPPFGALFAKVISEFEQEFEIRDKGDLFREGEFLGWYRTNNGKVFDYEALRPDEAYRRKESRLLTRRVADAAGRVRNRRLSQRIAEGLNTYDCVLVVYGAGHHVELGRLLGDLLGPALIEKP